jgi:acetyl esterase/lipase
VYPRRGFALHAPQAKAAGARALLVSYRLLPEGGGYPVPVDDVAAAYRWLLEQGSLPATSPSPGSLVT